MDSLTFDLAWLIIALPVVGFLIQALLGPTVVKLLGPKRGRWILGLLAVLPIVGGFAIAAAIVQTLSAMPDASRTTVVDLFPWIDLAGIRLPAEILIDPLSMTMTLIITGVGALIHLYSTGYMAEERDYSRFFAYMNLFVACMLLLVLANNLALLFVGWEGVGLCSYLLIGFWYKDHGNARAGNKAFIVNRIGDFGLMLGMFLLVALLTTYARPQDHRILSYDVLAIEAPRILAAHPAIATTVALLLFLGAVGKSAQFPLYLWLPDAMAGPTPVSALIHAATMVTSGVFLLNRLDFIFRMSPVAGAVIASVGAFTALFGALVAFGQTDIKKVLAYSTVSQLGFMFIACGSGVAWAGMYHVTTHAFFKALLFLGAGAVIHSMAHEQDMRLYGNLRKYLPITFVTMVVGCLTIAAVPGLSGFFSKDAILAGAIGGNFAVAGGVNLGYWSGILGLVVAALTAMYMARLTFLTFFGPERWRTAPVLHPDPIRPLAELAFDQPDPHRFFYSRTELALQDALTDDGHDHVLSPEHTPHEAPMSMTLPLIVLAIASAGAWLYLNKNLQPWLGSTAIAGAHPDIREVSWLMPASVVAALAGLAAGFAVYAKGLPESEGFDASKWSPFRRAAGNQFGFDRAMTAISIKGGREVGIMLWRVLDDTFIDGAIRLSGWIAQSVGQLFRGLQTGYVRMYALMMLAGVVAILGYFVFAVGKLGGFQ